MDDRRLSVLEIAEAVGISPEHVIKILLGWIFGRRVLRVLNASERTISCFLTGDETWGLPLFSRDETTDNDTGRLCRHF